MAKCDVGFVISNNNNVKNYDNSFQWVRVSDSGTSSDITEYAKVPGGWLYRTIINKHYSSAAISMVFVPNS